LFYVYENQTLNSLTFLCSKSCLNLLYKLPSTRVLLYQFNNSNRIIQQTQTKIPPEYLNMTNNRQLEQMRSQEASQSASFTLFPKLPTDLQIKIWKLSFVPRRVILMGPGHRQQLELLAGALLLVNFEARQIFLENYTKCFHDLGQKAVYFNFSLDILYVKSALTELQKLARQYPRAMGQIQWIDVKAQHREGFNPEWSSIYLGGLAGRKLITVRWNLGAEYQRMYEEDSEHEMTKSFGHLYNSLLPTPGSMLAAVFPSYLLHPRISDSRD
jgi:hypothetical protein